MAPLSSSGNWVYDVFLSFSGVDVRKGFISHFQRELDRKLIIAFNNNKIKRSHSLDPELKQAISTSKIAVVVLSKHYASSTWCLDELLEIMKCKKEFGQIVIPVFYDLDPSHVRIQTGEFGYIFEKTCQMKTEDGIQLWRQALTDVANLLGYCSENFDNEEKMIEAIASDLLGKLNLTPSKDFEEFVGMEDHIANISGLLRLESEEVRMVGIWGPSGIGKTTIARALYSRFSPWFQVSVFIDRTFLSNSIRDLDDYGMKLHLQENFLRKILGKKDIAIDHLGAVRERLNHQKALIFIDDLEYQFVLDALVGQNQWFGSGSRIIVVTNDKHLLTAHDIDHIYEVCLPSEELAVEMLCRFAFRKNSPPDGFKELCSKAALHVGNLPLGLRVLGSLLWRRDKSQWMSMLARLQNNLNGEIEKRLRVNYDRLDDKKDEAIFRQIACLSNGKKVKDINLLLADSDLNLDFRLQRLVDKSLIRVRDDTVEMHPLLQEMGKNMVRSQSNDPGGREFLVDSEDICDVLKYKRGTRMILGISLDIDEIKDLYIHEGAFKEMYNLRFLKIYSEKSDENKEVKWHVSKGFDYLPTKLRLLRLDRYPLRGLPCGFCSKNLVKLQMRESKLEKLWEGRHPLKRLKIMDLRGSRDLKEIPDLSTAINLETLRLNNCSSLVELPYSIQSLNKLKKLDMQFCDNLQVLPTGINLQSLNQLHLKGCSRLLSFPDISTNISNFDLSETAIEGIPSKLCLENLVELCMENMTSDKLWEEKQPLKPLMSMLPPFLTMLSLSDISSLVELPSSFQNFQKLERLRITNCINLEALPDKINFDCLDVLDLGGCSGLKSFPNISTNISLLCLNRTGIEEVPWWIEDFSRLSSLHMNGCNKLQCVFLNIYKLKHLETVDFSDCKALTEASFNGCPRGVSVATDDIHSKLLVTDDSSSCVSENYVPKVKLSLMNCFKLDQEALYQQLFFKSMELPGEEVPSYFIHSSTGTSLTNIPLLYTSQPQKFIKFTACAVVDSESISMDYLSFDIRVSCRFIDKLGNYLDLADGPLSFSTNRLGSHLVVFACCFFLNKGTALLADNNYYQMDIQFHLTSDYSELKLIGCGIRLLEDGLPHIIEGDKSMEFKVGGHEIKQSEDCGDSALELSSSCEWVYDVFLSFSREGEENVKFLCHFLEELDQKLIVAFKENDINKGQSMRLVIKHSRFAVVVFSREYVSSSWRLNELLEILRCKKELGQLVIPIYYHLERKQRGEFGKAFENTWQTKTEEETQVWRQALTEVANTLGYHSEKWGTETKMIGEIAGEVLNKLNFTPSMKKTELYRDDDACYSRPEELKDVDGKTDDILGDAKSDLKVKEAESVQCESRKGKNLIGEVNSEATSQNSIENEMVDPVKEEIKHGIVSESSTMRTYERHMPQHQVFINFWGEEVRFSFISHLVSALSREGVNAYTEKYEKSSEERGETFQRIKDSNIALVVFSSQYTESRCCLDELVKIKERMDEGKLLIIPIFYQVKPLQVQQLEGEFDLKLWNLLQIHQEHSITKWTDALESVAAMLDVCLKENSSESEFITSIVKKVKEVIWEEKTPSILLSTGRGETTKWSTGKEEKHGDFLTKCPLFGREQRMKQLEQMLEFDCNETRIIGVVGMAGIGKTTLAMMLHEKWNCKFVRCVSLLSIRKKFEDYRPTLLRKNFFEVLLGGKFEVVNDKTTYDSIKEILLQRKVFVILDDVSNMKQLKFLLGDLKWIKKGSKIVITTHDKSLIEGFAHDTYVVPSLNYGEAIQLFNYHAFGDHGFYPTVISMKMCMEFLDFCGGNPLAIELLGKQLHGSNEALLKMRQGDLTYLRMVILKMFRFSCNELSEKQKDVFLDIACFFRSEDDYFVRSLVDSGGHDATDAESEVIDLAHRGMITISGSRVEMHDLLCMFGKIFSSQALLEENGGKSRLLFTQEIIDALTNQKDTKSIRGIFLDMSEVTKGMVFHRLSFINMINLRYLKIYDSFCTWSCGSVCKLHLPDGLEFPLENVQYLHWVKFQLEELPADFRPQNLVDLRLPYSRIKRVWEGVKDTPRLKWVDLSHSSQLLNLSALANAESLQRLNLEGCTNLFELPGEMQNMKSLIYLNLKGCERLWCLPEINLISLKTLILSNCSGLEEFQVISKSLEVLHLDGTAIKGLPPSIKDLQRLVLFNMKNCRMLECLPNCLGHLKVLEELILSGCTRLKNLPDVKHGMKHIQILLLDGTGVNELPSISCFNGFEDQAYVDMVLQSSGSYPRRWPGGFNGISSLRRLCLSGNDSVCLQSDIGQLYNLTWLDVKQCKKLRSIPMLPPRLQYFDAHGCDSLEEVANPLALLVQTEQANAIFNFSSCNKLDKDAQDSIISYTRRRSQLMLGVLSRYSGGSSMGTLTRTCFPGWEVPEWFSHRGSGSILEPKLHPQLHPHWCDNRFTGIALCAVILFPAYHEQRNRLSVNCNCEFKKKNGNTVNFSCTIGQWNGLSNTPQKLESAHVFIGYTSMSDIHKNGGYDEEGCFCTARSLEFQVTDGTDKVEGCEVLQCGFSLVYVTDEGDHWDAKSLVISNNGSNVCSFNTNQFTEQQKSAFLNIACFFRSEDEYLLDSGDPDSNDVVSEVRDLAEKFFITITDGRVEMNGRLSTSSKDHASPERLILWEYGDIVDKLRKMENLEEADSVRGVFIEMSDVKQNIAMEPRTFINMRNLRYLKIYKSSCLQKCKSDCKLQFPDGLDFPLEEVRYFHWLEFPLEELPRDFRPKNLVDLRLPYSNIERLWKGVKDTPRLKWVDLSHSSKLLNISALAKAETLQRLNLEGCLNLEDLPRYMQNMKSLVYLNLRGCIRLWCLPKMNLVSLKTLILSNCTNFKEFQVTAKNLEFLHLDGTAIKGLPPSIQKLQRLVLLNLKNCKFLESILNCLGKLKVLEELILSGCSRLKNLPDVRHSMKHVQILLFDGTGVDELPDMSCFIGSKGQASVDMSFQPFRSFFSPREWPLRVTRVSSLQRLCLSGHDFVSLHNDIGQLYNLAWLDLKQCKKLRTLASTKTSVF